MIKRQFMVAIVGATALLMGLLGFGPTTASASTDAMVPAGVLGAVPATAKTLSYKWERQKYDYNCGPTATKMALSARMASPPSQDTIGAWEGTDENGTDDISNVVSALNHYLNTGWYARKPISDPPTAAQRALLKQDLVFDIDHGYAMVGNVVSGWRPPGYPSGTIYHYVAIVGYASSGDSAVIADPAGAGPTGSSWHNVPKQYTISTANLATWIGEKAYAA
ncbi:C39 family peptidase [Fodinicola feengrottensis]|uniref:Peptidase C39-like domain-containing protein n=1 Tax=Fodinicola feengrottensis TaxID=435914 RepID=A0ABN2GQ97_9ACTN|nr:C39 family peptidase [Fodinicola feengrottensis]